MVDCKGIEYSRIEVGLAQDLTGQKFTRLTPLYRVQTIKPNKTTQWLCQCDCGNLVVASAINLKRQHSQSCGCLCREIVKQQLKYKVGDNINGFIFLGRDLTKRNSSKAYYWKVRCPYCQKEYSVSPETVRNNRIQSCGCLNLSHGELQIKTLLDEFQIKYQQQVMFPNLVSSRGGQLRFDFGIYDGETLICLVEYDGEQHFIEKENRFGGGADLSIIQENDALKNNFCLKHNITLIRIPYTLKKLTIHDIIPEQFLIKIKKEES